MAKFPQDNYMSNIYQQPNIQNNYVVHSQNNNNLSRQETSQNDSKPSAIISTFFEFIRPYFKISQMDIILSIKDIFLPIKSRTRILDLYIPSVSLSTFILLSTIYRVLYDNSYSRNPAEMLARVASWISFLICLEVLLLKFFFFIFKVQTNTRIIPKSDSQETKIHELNQYNRPNSSRPNYIQPSILQSDGVPLLAILSVTGYKFTPMSASLFISLLYRGTSFWFNPIKFYSYLTASINAFRCFEALNMTTFTNTPVYEMKKSTLSHTCLITYIASAMQFLISWSLMPKELN